MPQILLPSRLPMRLSFGGVADKMSWTDLSKDLLEVACAISLADRLTLRSRFIDRPRQIDLRLLVRKPREWMSIAADLEEVLATLTRDRFSFQFVARTTSGIKYPKN